MLWRGAVSRRRMQETAAKGEELSRKGWSDRLGMVLTLIIFLFAALGGIYSMAYMKFPADALLFPSKQF